MLCEGIMAGLAIARSLTTILWAGVIPKGAATAGSRAGFRLGWSLIVWSSTCGPDVAAPRAEPSRNHDSGHSGASYVC